MRILMVTPMPPQPQAPGAIPLVLYAGLCGLSDQHQVTIVTIAGQEPGEQQAIHDLRQQGVDVHAVVREEPQGIDRWRRRWRLASTWLRGEMPWRSVWFWEPALQPLLSRLVSSGEYDLVIVEDSAMGMYEYPGGTPVLFTEHEVRRPRRMDWSQRGEKRLLPWVFSEIDWRRWPAYQRRVWSKFDQVQVFSSRDADAVAEIEPELDGRVEINPFGIVLPEPARQECEQPNSLLFVGNYTHAPNVDAAVWLAREIMPRWVSQHPQARLRLVGIYPPPEVQALESENIQVAGHVEDIRPLIDEAAVVLAPVRIGGGMRMKVLQSLAAGKAVVTTQRGAEGLDVWGEPPPLEIAEDAESFARAVSALLDDPQRRSILGRQARQFVAEHFSPQAYARRIETIYARMKNGGDETHP
jgi:polysaccharide biosynthesis protein PslH